MTKAKSWSWNLACISSRQSTFKSENHHFPEKIIATTYIYIYILFKNWCSEHTCQRKFRSSTESQLHNLNQKLFINSADWSPPHVIFIFFICYRVQIWLSKFQWKLLFAIHEILIVWSSHSRKRFFSSCHFRHALSLPRYKLIDGLLSHSLVVTSRQWKWAEHQYLQQQNFRKFSGS